jgi:hypothetical protein
MNLSFIWMALGATFFIFRIYLVEFHLAQILKAKKFYLSRYLNLMLCLFLVLNLSSNILALTIFISFWSILYIFFIEDISFFIKSLRISMNIKKQNETKNCQDIWVIIERITLRLPILCTGVWSLISQPPFFLTKVQSFDILVGTTLNFGLFLIFDPRIALFYPSRKTLSEGWVILFGNLMGFILIMLYYTYLQY